MPDRRLCFLGDAFANGTSDPTLLGYALLAQQILACGIAGLGRGE